MPFKFCGVRVSSLKTAWSELKAILPYQTQLKLSWHPKEICFFSAFIKEKALNVHCSLPRGICRWLVCAGWLVYITCNGLVNSLIDFSTTAIVQRKLIFCKVRFHTVMVLYGDTRSGWCSKAAGKPSGCKNIRQKWHRPVPRSILRHFMLH